MVGVYAKPGIRPNVSESFTVILGSPSQKYLKSGSESKSHDLAESVDMADKFIQEFIGYVSANIELGWEFSAVTKSEFG